MPHKSRPYINPLLAEPWQIIQPDLILTSKAEAERENMKTATAKVLALFEHYSISPTLLGKSDAFEKLAIALAIEHVPGFQVRVAKEVGRPNELMRAFGMQLFWDVYQKSGERNGNCSWACQQLVKTPQYSQYKWQSLYARYKEVLNKHPASPMMRYLVQRKKTETSKDFLS